jgi:hypothetical protein
VFRVPSVCPAVKCSTCQYSAVQCAVQCAVQGKVRQPGNLVAKKCVNKTRELVLPALFPLTVYLLSFTVHILPFTFYILPCTFYLPLVTPYLTTWPLTTIRQTKAILGPTRKSGKHGKIGKVGD